MRTKLAVLTAVAVGLLLAPGVASASTVTDGTANWGVSQSFRDYITGSPPPGTITAGDGATVAGDGTIDFTPASGTIDADAQTGGIQLGGSVNFNKYGGALDVTLANPRVVYEGDAGTLYTDVTNAGETTDDVAVATLDLTEVTPAVVGDQIVADPIPATLTAEGSTAAFDGAFPAGTALDPVSFAVGFSDEPVSPGTVTKPTAKQSVSKRAASVKLGKATCEAESCTLSFPKRVVTEIKGGKKDGKAVRFSVAGPKQLGQGESATVKATIAAGSLKKLKKGGKAKIDETIVLSAAGVDEQIKAKVTVSAK